MIGRGEITKQAQRDGIDAQTVERDYILAHVALYIAAIAGQRVILKGGPNLRLAHYRDYRYSADLDYSLVDITPNEALQLIASALEQCRQRTGIATLALDTETTPPRINYIGPLAARPRTINLDLADDRGSRTSDLPTSGYTRIYATTESGLRQRPTRPGDRCAGEARRAGDNLNQFTLRSRH